ncbi:MAG TPA: rhodanese-like domain-containing protein [Bacteroidia bacterium]
MQEITVKELKSMMDAKEDFQLVDVREQYEYDICEIGGELIPMGEVADNIAKIVRDKKVVVHCKGGKRSASVISMLEQEHGYKNLYNLKGGIMAWANEVDSSVPKY